MKSDAELQLWRHQWHSQPLVPIDLISKVERQTVYMKFYRLAEVLVTVFIGGGTMVAAAVTKNPTLILLAGGTWLFIVCAWVFSLRQTRGLWMPGAPTTASYLDLSIRRCHWKIADSRYDVVQSVLLTVFVFFIDYRLLSAMGTFSSWGPWWFWMLGAVMAGGLAVFFASRARKARAELQYLSALQSQLKAD